MRFKSYWRTTVVAAIFLHFFVCLGLALALPLLDFEGAPIAAQEMEVVDLSEGDDGNADTEKPEPPEVKPPAPEPPAPEKPEPEPEELVLPVEMSPTEAAELDETVAEMQKQEEEAKKRGEDGKDVRPPAPPNQEVGTIISSGMTPDTRGTDFRGTVGVLVDVDAQGKIVGVFLSQKSGRFVVDQIVLNALKTFKFEPALDMNGNPMKTKRLIKFPFDGSGPHPFDDDGNKRMRAKRELFLRERQQQGNAPAN